MTVTLKWYEGGFQEVHCSLTDALEVVRHPDFRFSWVIVRGDVIMVSKYY